MDNPSKGSGRDQGFLGSPSLPGFLGLSGLAENSSRVILPSPLLFMRLKAPSALEASFLKRGLALNSSKESVLSALVSSLANAAAGSIFGFPPWSGTAGGAGAAGAAGGVGAAGLASSACTESARKGTARRVRRIDFIRLVRVAWVVSGGPMEGKPRITMN